MKIGEGHAYVRPDHRRGYKSRWMIDITVNGKRRKLRRRLEGGLFESIEQAQHALSQLDERVRDGSTLAGAHEWFVRRSRSSLALLRKNSDLQETWKEDAKERMLEGAKRRACQKGLDFTVSREDIPIPHTCPVLGIELTPPSGFAGRESSPSIDRIDPSQGYISGNVVVMSWRANSLKRNATSEELHALADWLRFTESLPPVKPSARGPATQKSEKCRS